MKHEIIENGVLLSVKPFSTNNARARVEAEVTIPPGTDKRAARIFVRELDLRGMTVSDAVVLIAALRTVIEEAGKVVEEGKALREKKRLAKERSAKRKLARAKQRKK